MRRGLLGVMVFLIVMFSVASSSFVNAATNNCNLSVQMLNQDPYPAIPGNYAKVVFKVDGLSDSSCGEFSAQLLPDFPISFDTNSSSMVSVDSGFYAHDYSNSLIIPFKVKVSNDALDGDNLIRLKYGFNIQGSSATYVTNNFNLAVNNTQTDFDVIITGYSYSTGVMTFDILNKGKSNAQALTLSIPQQNGLTVVGPSENVVGSLNSNDDTTVNFNVVPSGSTIKVNLEYNDLNGNRRSVEKDVAFDSRAYESTRSSSSGLTTAGYLLLITWILIVVYFVYRYFSNKRKRKAEQARRFR